MRLHDLLAVFDSFEVRGESDPAISDVDVSSIVHDDRDVLPGALFCCFPGARVDGHDFAERAVANGAVACLVERFVPDRGAAGARPVGARRARPAVQPLLRRSVASAARDGCDGNERQDDDDLSPRVDRRAAGERVALIGTIATRIDGVSSPSQLTTPEATDLQRFFAELRDAGVGTVAMEVSSHALEQHRVDGTHFSAVCFTNLTQDHLDFHGTLDAYFDAKARLFTSSFTSRAAINIDDERGRELARRAAAAGLDVLTYGLDATADVTATELDLQPDHTTFTLHCAGVHLAASFAARRAVQRAQQHRGGGDCVRGRSRPRCDRPRARSAGGGAGPDGARRDVATVHGDRRLRAHARRASERAGSRPPADGSGRPRARRLRLRRRS